MGWILGVELYLYYVTMALVEIPEKKKS